MFANFVMSQTAATIMPTSTRRRLRASELPGAINPTAAGAAVNESKQPLQSARTSTERQNRRRRPAAVAGAAKPDDSEVMRQLRLQAAKLERYERIITTAAAKQHVHSPPEVPSLTLPVITSARANATATAPASARDSASPSGGGGGDLLLQRYETVIAAQSKRISALRDRLEQYHSAATFSSLSDSEPDTDAAAAGSEQPSADRRSNRKRARAQQQLKISQLLTLLDAHATTTTAVAAAGAATAPAPDSTAAVVSSVIRELLSERDAERAARRQLKGQCRGLHTQIEQMQRKQMWFGAPPPSQHAERAAVPAPSDEPVVPAADVPENALRVLQYAPGEVPYDDLAAPVSSDTFDGEKKLPSNRKSKSKRSSTLTPSATAKSQVSGTLSGFVHPPPPPPPPTAPVIAPAPLTAPVAVPPPPPTVIPLIRESGGDASPDASDAARVGSSLSRGSSTDSIASLTEEQQNERRRLYLERTANEYKLWLEEQNRKSNPPTETVTAQLPAELPPATAGATEITAASEAPKPVDAPVAQPSKKGVTPRTTPLIAPARPLSTVPSLPTSDALTSNGVGASSFRAAAASGKPIAGKRLDRVLELLSFISSEIDHSVMLRRVCEEISSLIGAQRCTIFFVDRSRNLLWSKAGNELIQPIRVKLGVGIAGSVAKSGKMITLSNASKDSRFFGADSFAKSIHTGPAAPSATVAGGTSPAHHMTSTFGSAPTKAMICIPLRTPERETFGVLQVINKASGGIFTDVESIFAQIICAHLSHVLWAHEIYHNSMREKQKTAGIFAGAHTLLRGNDTLQFIQNLTHNTRKYIDSDYCVLLVHDAKTHELVVVAEDSIPGLVLHIPQSYTHIRAPPPALTPAAAPTSGDAGATEKAAAASAESADQRTSTIRVSANAKSLIARAVRNRTVINVGDTAHDKRWAAGSDEFVVEIKARGRNAPAPPRPHTTKVFVAVPILAPATDGGSDAAPAATPSSGVGGVLVFGRITADKTITDTELDRVTEFTSLFSVALERLRMTDIRTERLKSKLSAIHTSVNKWDNDIAHDTAAGAGGAAAAGASPSATKSTAASTSSGGGDAVVSNRLGDNLTAEATIRFLAETGQSMERLGRETDGLVNSLESAPLPASISHLIESDISIRNHVTGLLPNRTGNRSRPGSSFSSRPGTAGSKRASLTGTHSPSAEPLYSSALGGYGLPTVYSRTGSPDHNTGNESNAAAAYHSTRKRVTLAVRTSSDTDAAPAAAGKGIATSNRTTLFDGRVIPVGRVSTPEVIPEQLISPPHLLQQLAAPVVRHPESPIIPPSRAHHHKSHSAAAALSHTRNSSQSSQTPHKPIHPRPTH